jgi:hypothetical protein
MGEALGQKVHPRPYSEGYYSDLTLERMAAGDFHKTLELIENAYEYIKQDKPRRIMDPYGYQDPTERINLKNFDERMIRLMLLAEGDLGIFWKDGKFYPAGARELDEALIEDALDWLKQYPSTKETFQVALGHYKKSMTDLSAGKDAITNAYTSVEFFAKEYLKNKKSFDKNSDELIEKLALPKEYKNVVHYYKQIAHEYGSRHAGSNPTHREVEAFIYLTGLLLRLLSR